MGSVVPFLVSCVADPMLSAEGAEINRMWSPCASGENSHGAVEWAVFRAGKREDSELWSSLCHQLDHLGQVT